MVNVLNINKINKCFHSWRVADARVVGEKNTHNGMGRLLPKSNTNKGTNKCFHSWRVADARVVGEKNTHNGMGRLLPKSNTNKGTKLWRMRGIFLLLWMHGDTGIVAGRRKEIIGSRIWVPI